MGTIIEVDFKHIAQVTIKCGIYQGDALFPLLFCIGNIADIENSYKYMGIPQANGNYAEATRKAATTKFLQRVRQVLK